MNKTDMSSTGLSESEAKKRQEQYGLNELDEAKKQIKGVFMHKVGSVLVNSTDSLVISAFVGVSLLGVYSNYAIIALGLISLLNLFFSSIVSNISHGFYKLKNDTFKKYFYFSHGLNFGIGMIMFLGFYAIVNQLITLFFALDIG